MTHLPTAEGTPGPEIDIDAALVRTLLKTQHPDLADYALRPMGSGWDNAMFRLDDTMGHAMTVRLPRRKAAANLIRHEQMWLPRIAKQLSISAPVPLREGQPSDEYPYYWSVLPWLEGETADLAEPDGKQAKQFGAFLRSLHTPNPNISSDDAPSNPFRGIPLRERSRQTLSVLQQLETNTPFITPSIKQIWHDAVNAPIATEKRWLHGDLHPRNILVKDGIISGIIDWGDITSGDVATDLAAVWMLFSESKAQTLAFSHYGASELEIVRSKGWAISFAAFLLQTGLVDNPRNAAIGEKIFKRLQAP